MINIRHFSWPKATIFLRSISDVSYDRPTSDMETISTPILSRGFTHLPRSSYPPSKQTKKHWNNKEKSFKSFKSCPLAQVILPTISSRSIKSVILSTQKDKSWKNHSPNHKNCQNHSNHDITSCDLGPGNLIHQNFKIMKIFIVSESLKLPKSSKLSKSPESWHLQPKVAQLVLCSQQWKYASKLWKSSQSQNH